MTSLCEVAFGFSKERAMWTDHDSLGPSLWTLSGLGSALTFPAGPLSAGVGGDVRH